MNLQSENKFHKVVNFQLQLAYNIVQTKEVKGWYFTKDLAIVLKENATKSQVPPVIPSEVKPKGCWLGNHLKE